MTLSDFFQYLVDPSALPEESLPDPVYGGLLGVLGAVITGAVIVWLSRKHLSKPAEIARAERDMRTRLADCLMILGSYLVVSLSAIVLLNKLGFSGELSPSDEHLRLLIFTSLSLLMIPAFLIARSALFLQGGSGYVPSKSPKSWGVLLAIFALWIPFTISVHFVNLWVVEIFSLQTEEQAILSNLKQSSDYQLPAAIMTAVIAAPLIEEFLFRFGLQGALRAVDRWVALIVASFAFAWMHGIVEQPQTALPVFALGLMLGWVYSCTQNIWHSITLHALHNGATLLIALN